MTDTTPTYSEGMRSLVDHLIKSGAIVSQDAASVMQSVDRKYYAPYDPYADKPQPIGFSATISAPHMHAYSLELLKHQLANGTKCLDVGSGSGYLTVCFAKMMKAPNAVSYGLEHIDGLIKLSIENIRKSPDKALLESGKVVFKEGDGRKGWKEHAPYDAIHVGAGAEELPKDLVDQLAKGGRMVIPVGKMGQQDFLVVDKALDGKVHIQKTLGVTYIPLTDKEKQCPTQKH